MNTALSVSAYQEVSTHLPKLNLYMMLFAFN
jgi:hypothetical protein